MPADSVRRRVVAVHPNAELYGSDRMYLMTVEALLRRDQDARVIPVIGGRGLLFDALVEREIGPSLRAFPVLRKQEVRRPVAAARWVIQFMTAVPRLAVWLYRLRADVVYVSTVICPVWVLAGRLAGSHVVVHVHESESSLPAPLQRLLLAQLRAAHAIIANSGVTASWIGQAGRRVRRRTVVVHNAVAEPKASSPAQWHDASARHALVVGRLNDRKGQHLALEAVRRLRSMGHDIGLTIIGDVFPGYESYALRLHDEVRRLDLNAHVAFEGFLADPSPYLIDADLLMVPSRVESFGNAAVEGLLAGTPVIASAVQGLIEVIEDGITGVLVPHGDIDGLVAAAHRILIEPELAERLRTDGQRDARRRFGIPRYGAAVAALVMGDEVSSEAGLEAAN